MKFQNPIDVECGIFSIEESNGSYDSRINSEKFYIKKDHIIRLAKNHSKNES